MNEVVSPIPMCGGCACGALRYEVEGPIEEAHHCHCSVCRRFHGAAFATYARVRTKKLRFVCGRDQLREFRSSTHVTRSFCGACGSSLLFAHAAVPELVWSAAGTLDDETAKNVAPDAHVFVGSKASWWTIADAISQHDEQRPEYARND